MVQIVCTSRVLSTDQEAFPSPIRAFHHICYKVSCAAGTGHGLCLAQHVNTIYYRTWEGRFPSSLSSLRQILLMGRKQVPLMLSSCDADEIGTPNYITRLGLESPMRRWLSPSVIRAAGSRNILSQPADHGCPGCTVTPVADRRNRRCLWTLGRDRFSTSR